MNAQAQTIYTDMVMDSAQPGTVVWLCISRSRVDISLGADLPYLPAVVRNRASGTGAQIEAAYLAALPEETTEDISSISLRLIKDSEGRWHTIASAVDYK